VLEFLSAQQQALLGWEKKKGYKDSGQSTIARDTIATVIVGDALPREAKPCVTCTKLQQICACSHCGAASAPPQASLSTENKWQIKKLRHASLTYLLLLAPQSGSNQFKRGRADATRCIHGVNRELKSFPSFLHLYHTQEHTAEPRRA
jgi:hypothetical protein